MTLILSPSSNAVGRNRGARENVENLKENLFLGALWATKATLRENDC